MSTTKPKTIFEHLAGIKDKKVPWNTLSELDKKSFSPFLINRFLSMNQDLIEFVNEFQIFSIGLLEPRDVYKVYYDFLPKVKTYDKYIKGKGTSKYDSELIDYLIKWYKVSSREVIQYLEIMDKDDVKSILQAYGLDKKKITKLTSFKKK